MSSLEADLKQQAKSIGFDLVGIASADAPARVDRLRDWLDQGYAGEMDYMSQRAEARRHPESILAGVRSVVMVGINYHTRPAVEAAQLPTGRVSNYAWGDDYHILIWDKLNRLLAWVREQRPDCRGRGVVDTAPLLERDFGRLAGLGWFAKNTMLINKSIGSYFFLGALLLDIELHCDPPFEADHCGTCTRCLEACPTDAFAAPGVLDARKCISYLTIELRGPIPQGLRAPMADWLFGCDICQDVCPWNRKAPPTPEPGFAARAGRTRLDLMELLALSPRAFRERFRGTTILRSKRSGLLRNAAIALGNAGDGRAVPALIHALDDGEPLIRGAAAWALGCLGGAAAITGLQARLMRETDPSVLAELEHASKAAQQHRPDSRY